MQGWGGYVGVGVGGLCRGFIIQGGVSCDHILGCFNALHPTPV